MLSLTQKFLSLGAILSIFFIAGCDDPGTPEITPTYKWVEKGKVKGSSGERGSMLINEIGYAGSVTNEGKWDPDDVFIELLNKHPRPINVSGWRLEVTGDYNNAYRIPETDIAIPPNGYFVIAAKADGAYNRVDVVIPGLKLGKTLLSIELRDLDRKLMEDAGSTRHEIFAGGYDTVATRSMERGNSIFGNRGGDARNWHTNSDDEGGTHIKPTHRKYTIASPGEANSADYSGNSNAGNYE